MTYGQERGRGLGRGVVCVEGVRGLEFEHALELVLLRLPVDKGEAGVGSGLVDFLAARVDFLAARGVVAELVKVLSDFVGLFLDVGAELVQRRLDGPGVLLLLLLLGRGRREAVFGAHLVVFAAPHLLDGLACDPTRESMWNISR